MGNTVATQLKKQIVYWNGYAQDSGEKVWLRDPSPKGWVNSAFCGKGEQVMWYDAGSGPEPLSGWDMYPYVPNIVIDAKKAGRWITSYQSHTYDLVTFDWAFSGHRDGLADHVGLIIVNNPALSYVTTFEFNTLPDSGPQIRGAYFKRRYRADILGCVNRQPELGRPSDAPNPTGNVNAPADQDLNQWLDQAHIKTLQTTLGLTGADVDGVAGPITYKTLQKALGTPQDGVLSGGFSTAVKVLQQVIQVTPDGVLGPDTGKALAAFLDKGSKIAPPAPPAPPAPQPTPAPKPTPKPAAKLVVDGVIGKDSTIALEKWLGTKTDGVISSQDSGRRVNFPAQNWPTIQWVTTGKGDGSQVITALQRKLKISDDGIGGPGTVRALQIMLGFKGHDVDGIAGVKTTKALQELLNNQ